jgi:hypothetical protein
MQNRQLQRTCLKLFECAIGLAFIAALWHDLQRDVWGHVSLILLCLYRVVASLYWINASGRVRDRLLAAEWAGHMAWQALRAAGLAALPSIVAAMVDSGALPLVLIFTDTVRLQTLVTDGPGMGGRAVAC